MLPELFALIPDGVAGCSLEIAVAGMVVGAVLWLSGARFSRSLITLIAVAIGTHVGLRLPGWLGWGIDGMGIAVAGAVVLGVSGYLLHRTWVGLYLGTLLAAWAGICTWAVMSHGQLLPHLRWESGQGMTDALQLLWEQLPRPLVQSVSIAGMAGFTAGVVMAMVWPKLSRVVTWSLVGTTLLLTMLVAMTRTTGPQWVLSSSVSAQAAALAGLVALGAVIQWRLTPPLHVRVDSGREG